MFTIYNDLMKRILITLCALAIVFAFAFPRLNVQAVHAESGDMVETPPMSARTYYATYDQSGSRKSSHTLTEQEKESGTYITRNALYGTYAVLSFYSADQLVEVQGVDLEFAPAVAKDSSDSFVFEPKDENFPYFDISDEYDISCIWLYDAVGVYKVTVSAVIYEMSEENPEDEEEGAGEEAGDGEEDKDNEEEEEPIIHQFEYFFVCKSGETAFKALYSDNKSKTIIYNDSFDNIDINIIAGENYQIPQGDELRISNVQSDGIFYYEKTDKGLILQNTSNNENGIYQITFNVSCKYYVVDNDGKYILETGESVMVTVSIEIITRPHVTGVWDVLIGLGVLALLGGVIYAISYMTKQIQERQDTMQMPKRMPEHR